MAITATALTANKDTALTSTKTTASVTLHAGKLALLAVGTRLISGGPVTVSSVSSTGVTWQLVHVVTFSSNHARLEIWRTMPSSDSTGAVTITLSAVPTAALWSLNEFANVKVTGTWGSDAVIQVDDEQKTTGNGGLVTLSAFGSTDNAGFATWMTSGTAPNINPGSGFTELAETSPGSGIATLETEWKINDASVDAGWSGSGPSAGIALEMGFATGTNHPQALAATSTFAPTLSRAVGKRLDATSEFAGNFVKAIAKALALASPFDRGLSLESESIPGSTDITLAASSVFTPAMNAEKRGIHGNYEGHVKESTTYSGSTRNA